MATEIMTTHLPPIERPKGLILRVLYWALGRRFGRVPSWLTVFSARMPLAYSTWMGKVDTLNKKLTISQDTVALVRSRVNLLNGCTWCEDAGRWYAMTRAPHTVPKLEALHEYRPSPLFDAAERAALDFATELTERKHVEPATFAALTEHYSERQACEIVWVVSSNHLQNLNNLGLGIGSDGLCALASRPGRSRSGRSGRSRSSRSGQPAR